MSSSAPAWTSSLIIIFEVGNVKANCVLAFVFCRFESSGSDSAEFTKQKGNRPEPERQILHVQLSTSLD
jgi:hypothetical protein